MCCAEKVFQHKMREKRIVSVGIHFLEKIFV